MLPLRIRHRLTFATLAILAIAAVLSVVVAQPSSARPHAVETLELEPATPTRGTIPGTIPLPLAYKLYMPIVAGECGDGVCGE